MAEERVIQQQTTACFLSIVNKATVYLLSSFHAFDFKIFLWTDSDGNKMEGIEAKKEIEISEKCDCGAWTMETFNLAEETERYEKHKDDSSIYHFELPRFRKMVPIHHNKIQSW